MVSYHKFLALHERLKGDLPAPASSILDAIREVVPVLWRQLKDPTYFIERELPASASPYLWTGDDIAASPTEYAEVSG